MRLLDMQPAEIPTGEILFEGRDLLGLSEESEVLALVPQTMQQRAEIYYFIGLKNEQGGRFRDAADWYLMSVESGEGSIESRWAMDRLRQWSTEGRPEDRVAPVKPPAA